MPLMKKDASQFLINLQKLVDQTNARLNFWITTVMKKF